MLAISRKDGAPGSPSGVNIARSRPAENAAPAPWTTTTRTWPPRLRPMSRRAAHIAGCWALRRCGRSRVTVATAPDTFSRSPTPASRSGETSGGPSAATTSSPSRGSPRRARAGRCRIPRGSGARNRRTGRTPQRGAGCSAPSRTSCVGRQPACPVQSRSPGCPSSVPPRCPPSAGRSPKTARTGLRGRARAGRYGGPMPTVAPARGEGASRSRRATLGGASTAQDAAVWLALVAAGAALTVLAVRLRAPLHSQGVPFIGFYRWRLGPASGLAAAVAVVVVVAVRRGVPERLPVGWLLLASYCSAAVWSLALALVDGRAGLAGPLATAPGYLSDVATVDDPASYLRHFVARAGDYSVETRQHPPAPVLLLWTLRHGQTADQ